MKRLNVEKEWEILKTEIFENKPLESPYPEDVVNRRGLLLLAQCLLADYQVAKSRKRKFFFDILYQKTMQTYFAWER